METLKPILDKGVQATKKHWSRTLLCLLALIAIITAIFLLIRHPEKKSGGSIVESDLAAVAADQGSCSQIGVLMLKQGGHAVDAAVATALCLGVLNPSECVIGGGSFMMVRSSSTSKTQTFDMRETAPSASSQNMYKNNPEAKYRGPLSVAVPGELAGLYEAWATYGRLQWKTLFQPAIRLAKYGFNVSAYLGSVISNNAEKVTTDPGLRRVFAPDGKLLKAGDICFNVELGLTLEAVAEQGPQVFYDGIIGEKLVKDVKDAGGILTMEDLRNYRVNVPEAVTLSAMGYTILGMPPPSTGTVGLSLTLGVLHESYGNRNAAKGSLGLHRVIESLKHMFAIRMNLGDPNFVNISKTMSDMLSPSFGKKVQQMIFDNTTFPPEYYLDRWSQLRDHGTFHFSVVDEDRNAVAITTTINDYFGSGFRSLSTGIILNNEMDDFSTPTEISADRLPPAPHSFIEPNKRPASCMTPIIILKDGHLAGVTGASGGIYIIPGVVQVFLNHFILGMDPLAAVKSPRIYHKLIPDVVLYENWTMIDGDHIELSKERRNFLKERGHQLQPWHEGAVCQLIVQNLKDHGVNMGRKHGKDSNQIFHGTLTAVSYPRNDGKPAGL